MEDRRWRDQPETGPTDFEEVSSIKWDLINMGEDEEDIVHRMYRLVGDRWDLIAGRIPGRKAEEIERFWIMKHSVAFAEKAPSNGSRRRRRRGHRSTDRSTGGIL